MQAHDLKDADGHQLSIEEIVRLGAVNADFYNHTFFPRTFRVKSAQMHEAVWKALDSNNRLVNVQLPRDFAKTSILRTLMAKRIGYGVAHTILYIGKSEAAAIRSISWLRGQLENNRLYTMAFNLKAGKKQQDVELEVWHGTDKYPIWLMASGIGGAIRGINRDDFRPDLIILDDVLADDNCATEEQREKIADLIYGAVLQSLAPATESPDAKLVMLQTPLHQDDASTKALSDKSWRSLRFSCWTPETADLPPHAQESAWPERYPTATLRQDKKNYAARNRLSVFVREKECKLIAPETCSFKKSWLRFYDVAPEFGAKILVIDPVPPPSENQLAKNLHNKDYECLMVMQKTGNDFYILEYVTNRGHDPSWTIAEFFTLVMRHNPQMVVVEAIAYQRTLAWLLRRAMEQQGRFWAIKEYTDQRPKFQRIVDALNGPASAHHLHCHRDMTEFIDQFQAYKNVSHDDVIECAAIGVDELSQPMYDFNLTGSEVEDYSGDLKYNMGAP